MEVVKIRVWFLETAVTLRKLYILLTKLSYTQGDNFLPPVTWTHKLA